MIDTLEMNRGDAEKYLDMLADQLNDLLKEHTDRSRLAGDSVATEEAKRAAAQTRSQILRSVRFDDFEDDRKQRPVMKSRVR